MLCDLLCLPFFTLHILKIHPCCSLHLYLTPFYEWIIRCMDIPHFLYPSSLNGHWDISTFWLLWITLLWTSTYRFLSRHEFSIIWGVYLRGELLGYIVILCLNFLETAMFQNSFTILPSTSDKKDLWKTQSWNKSYWWKTGNFTPKVRNKTRMSVLITSVQCYTGSSSQDN